MSLDEPSQPASDPLLELCGAVASKRGRVEWRLDVAERGSFVPLCAQCSVDAPVISLSHPTRVEACVTPTNRRRVADMMVGTSSAALLLLALPSVLAGSFSSANVKCVR